MLIDLAAEITARCGLVILSGILAGDVPRIAAAYPRWRIAARRDQEGWTALRLER